MFKSKITATIAFSFLLTVFLTGCDQPVQEINPDLDIEADEVVIEEVADVILDNETLFTTYGNCDNASEATFTDSDTFGAYGKFTFTGFVEKFEEPRAFVPEETITVIRLVVSSGDLEAIAYFENMIERGNGVNTMNRAGELMFEIGLLEYDSIMSTASISSLTSDKILSAIDSGEEMTLNMVLPLYGGHGAPDEFTFACSIE